MNPIDKLELLSNVSALRREAKALLADATGAAHSAHLRRILMILAYMREHLEMVAMPQSSDEGEASGLANLPAEQSPKLSDLP